MSGFLWWVKTNQTVAVNKTSSLFTGEQMCSQIYKFDQSLILVSVCKTGLDLLQTAVKDELRLKSSQSLLSGRLL